MRYYVYYAIALLVLVIDFITKKLVVTQMELYEKIPVIGNFFLITSHRNRGAAFGILQDQRIFFLVITVLITVGIIWYMYSVRNSANAWLLIGLSLILGGAIGNFVDRFRFGEVVDFFQFNFGTYTFPIFNIADSAIVCGVGLVLIDAFIGIREEKRLAKHNGKEEISQHEEQPTS